MANKEKRSSEDLANGEKSETKEAQDSPNAEPNNEVKLKKPKIDLERVRARADQSIDLGVTTEYTVIPIRNPSRMNSSGACLRRITRWTLIY